MNRLRSGLIAILLSLGALGCPTSFFAGAGGQVGSPGFGTGGRYYSVLVENTGNYNLIVTYQVNGVPYSIDLYAGSQYPLSLSDAEEYTFVAWTPAKREVGRIHVIVTATPIFTDSRGNRWHGLARFGSFGYWPY